MGERGDRYPDGDDDGILGFLSDNALLIVVVMAMLVVLVNDCEAKVHVELCDMPAEQGRDLDGWADVE